MKLSCNVLRIFKLRNCYLGSGCVNFPCEKPLSGDEQDVPQPFVLVGDEAFALSKHLLRPFTGRNLNDERRMFNYRLSRARQHIEHIVRLVSYQINGDYFIYI